ncbi:KpsF/GutQ family sugar-phosphate isomerase [Desulfomicrobium sp. ZS1]|uniref:KpsF/GutQ family sugar-phosphate isomerase n=1 Tax=Desulfomicrobium sp. ZS1 TaxID=2952228 RepID=UPI0020B20ADC|nr:KpsF/GutQ family sugar-phosphate isomerase [Desulfomicrobium sp. ZS1]UTF51207.1 KpsF/GutQ family sugar-phosphate isomerase [Desulfomicrobium sp. ZS1]
MYSVGPYRDTALNILVQEADALVDLAHSLDASFDSVIDALLRIPGRIAVTGMGKSGHVARKVAATLSSTGSPAFFIHPAEASHGDLGMLTARDAVIVYSNSGETTEIGDILLFASRHGIPIIGVTKNCRSYLGRHADYCLQLPEFAEACPLGCAPTTSTTLMMALGDAIALSLLQARGFSAEDFHGCHPGGKLGRKLMQVKDIMHGESMLPLADVDTPMAETLCIMTGKGFGCAGIIKNGSLVGIVTDGDLRRHMGPDLLSLRTVDVMTIAPLTVAGDVLAAKALNLMQSKSITSLFVTDGDIPIGIIHIHDCLRAGVQ